MLRRSALAAALLSLAITHAEPAVRADPHAPARPSGFLGAQLEQGAGGLHVMNVIPNSPAERAGIRVDDVIVRAHGVETGSVVAFTLSVRAAGPNARYPLVVRRGAQQLNLNVQLTAAPTPPAQGGGRGPATGQPAPALSASLVMGSGPTDIAQLRGRVVIVDFWASWCGPCRMVMPELNQLHQRYQSQGLSVLGVSDESATIGRRIGMSMNIQYTLATAPDALSRYNVESLPTLVVIDRQGNVQSVMIGAGHGAQLETLVQRLLRQP